MSELTHILMMVAMVAGCAGALALACHRSPIYAPAPVRRAVYRRQR